MNCAHGPHRGGSETRNQAAGVIRLMTRFLGGGVIAPLLLVGVSLSSAQAQSADSAQLQAEINALKAQSAANAAQFRAEIEALRAQIKATQVRKVQPAQQAQASLPPGNSVNQGASAPYEPPFFADKKLHLYGITITPGGYFEAAGIWRSRNEQADLGSNWSGIPMENSPLAHMNELRFSARGTRGALLVQGEPNPSTIVSGYGELDFLGAAQTADSNEKNAYNPRIRQLYASADWNDWGVHLLGGQAYSLTTTNFNGITPRNEVLPPVIDSQYLPGFVYKRQPQIRLTKDFGPALWASVSVENPQTTFATSCATAATSTDGPSALPPGGGTAQIACASPGGSAFDKTNDFSLNHIPDIVGKLAFEPTIDGHEVHLEGFGLYRDFYDQVSYTPLANGNYTNYNTTGWGIGGGLVAQVVPKFVDVQANVLYGRGIGSYGSGQLSDVTFNQNGSEVGIPELIFMAGATVHATPALDVYVYGGSERESSQYFKSGTTYYGIGTPIANNTGCYIDNSADCTGNTRDLWQVTGGFWEKIYQGAFGEARVGLQYSYTRRDLFPGAATATSPTLGASTDDHVVLASIRYYPFAGDLAPSPPVIAKY